jgi:hypothetical protein
MSDKEFLEEFMENFSGLFLNSRLGESLDELDERRVAIVIRMLSFCFAKEMPGDYNEYFFSLLYEDLCKHGHISKI